MHVENESMVVETANYSPLQINRKLLRQLNELLPRFREMDEELRRLLTTLGNGDIVWKPKPIVVE